MRTDPGKGSKRRPGDNEAFSENFDRIFGNSTPERSRGGRKVYRQVKNEDGSYSLVELEKPPPKYSEDLIWDGTVKSTVDGSVLRTKADLVDHNLRNNVQCFHPGMVEDAEKRRKEIHEETFGSRARERRIEDIKRALENPVVGSRPVFDDE